MISKIRIHPTIEEDCTCRSLCPIVGACSSSLTIEKTKEISEISRIDVDNLTGVRSRAFARVDALLIAECAADC
jgi:hypothetical protein